MIQFKDTHIGYNKSVVHVEGLHVHNNRLYVLIGRNGAGKSTLLKSIVGEVPLLKGSIHVDSTSVASLDNAELSKKVAFVRTHFPPTNFLSVYDYIALGRSPYTNTFGRLTDEDYTIINNAIELLEISYLKDKFTSDISDGERQLVNIAKAIAQKTEIILLDEPTAFLDYTNKQKVIQILKNIAQNLSKCVIISSHDLDIALNYKCEFLAIKDNELMLLPQTSDKKSIVETIY